MTMTIYAGSAEIHALGAAVIVMVIDHRPLFNSFYYN